MIFLMGDLDLPLRDRTYTPPAGSHVTLVRGRNLTDALEHLAARPDCRALAVIGAPAQVPDLAILAGRRLLVTDGDRDRLRALSQAGLAAGAEVEWLHEAEPSLSGLARWALPVTGIVLAAGSGSRMGTQKLLLEIDGQPMVCHAIEAASEGGCSSVVVVYSGEDVRAAVEGRAAAVHNPDAATGMASSLHRGLGATAPEAAAVMVLLGDQPLVGSRTVDLLLRAWRREGSRPAVAAGYGGEKGQWRPPVVIARSVWPELMLLRGDAGARQVFERSPELLDTVGAPGRADDVDTPRDYQNIINLFPSRGAGNDA